MKVIIAGSRGFDDYEFLDQTMHELFWKGAPGLDGWEVVDSVISGGAKGADTLGAAWADEHCFPVHVYKPDWDTHGKKAGFLRNEEMAIAGDILVAFWDGISRGTMNMISAACVNCLEIHVYNYKAWNEISI
jgi:hypothetical protein